MSRHRRLTFTSQEQCGAQPRCSLSGDALSQRTKTPTVVGPSEQEESFLWLLGRTRPIKSLCALQVTSLQVHSEKPQQFGFEQIFRLTWLQTDQVKSILRLRDRTPSIIKVKRNPSQDLAGKNRAFGCSELEFSPPMTQVLGQQKDTSTQTAS